MIFNYMVRNTISQRTCKVSCMKKTGIVLSEKAVTCVLNLLSLPVAGLGGCRQEVCKGSLWLGGHAMYE